MRCGISLGMSGVGLSEQLEVARRAERAGVDSVASLEAGYDVFAAVAAFAAVTGTPRLFSGVATWVRPAVATARAAATVDELSAGRFVLGLGTMPRRWSQDHFGLHVDRPVARMREYVEVVRGVLASAERPLHHRGEFFDVRDYRLPRAPLRERIPIHLGATRPGMARLAGEVADGVLVNFVSTERWLTEVLLPSVGEGEKVSGGVVERGVLLCCAVAERPAVAYDRLRESFRGHLEVPYFYQVAAHAGFELSRTRELVRAGDTDGALAAIPNDLLDQLGAAGDPSSVCARVRSLASHVDHVQLMPPRHLHGVALTEALAGIEEVVRLAVAGA